MSAVTKFQLKNIKICTNTCTCINCFAAATAVIILQKATDPFRAVYILEMQTKGKRGGKEVSEETH